MQPLSPPPRSTARREDEAHDALVRSAQVGRQEEVVRAKSFAKVDAACHFIRLSCASVAEYGVRIGYGSRQALDYVAAGRVMGLCPAAEQMVLDGAVLVSTLAIIEPLLTDPTLRPRDEQGEPMAFEAILEWARLRPDRELRHAVHRRREQARTKAQTVARTLHLSSRGVHDLDRSQVLMSRKDGRTVSQSEAAERAFRFFVEKHDPLERTSGTRRLPNMPARGDGTRNPRSIPQEVVRALMARHGDVCAIDFCEHRIWLENSHHLAHALGGGNELEDQDRLCTLHHRMKDHGEIVWVPGPEQPNGTPGSRGHYRTPAGAILNLKPVQSAGDPICGVDPPDRVRERGPPSLATCGRGSHASFRTCRHRLVRGRLRGRVLGTSSRVRPRRIL